MEKLTVKPGIQERPACMLDLVAHLSELRGEGACERRAHDGDLELVVVGVVPNCMFELHHLE